MLLKRVSATLKSVCPKGSMISRIGGDEFVVIITNSSDVRELVDRIYKKIENKKTNNVVISISVGWEIKTSNGISMREIFINAENHMYRKKLIESQSMRHQTIKAIIETLNKKNAREKMHSENVSVLSRKIGEAMGFSNQTLKEIEMAGLLHDIGKIAVGEDILNKPSRLTSIEYAEVKKHSEVGYQILKSVDTYSGLADFILAHHERFDGNGYPRGLSGDEIPLISRIISIADSYEAMVSDRAYRKGVPHETAIQEIKMNSGTQFDPVIVHLFINLFN
jgi:putative nucleotidyltransferase with HDIG domain